MEKHVNRTTLLLCGSSKVGKSTLINAICQQKLTRTSASLNSQTQTVEQYSYQYSHGTKIHETVIWDSPGIESWNRNDVCNYMIQLIEQTQPLCMIYCASPGSFAQLNHVKWLVAECYRRDMFCALVCTNMWAGRNRQEIVNGFQRILTAVHPTIQPTVEGKIIHYDKVALVAMVNSREYIDEDFNVRKSASGVEELIFGIGKSLKQDLMFAWFKSVSQNKSFWSSMSSKVGSLLKMPGDAINSLLDTANGFLDLLYGLDESSHEDVASTVTHVSLFHDAEMIDDCQRNDKNKLSFIFKNENIEMVMELSEALSILEATACQAEQMVNEQQQQLIKLTAEFKDVKQMEALCKVWQMASTTICELAHSN